MTLPTTVTSKVASSCSKSQCLISTYKANTRQKMLKAEGWGRRAKRAGQDNFTEWPVNQQVPQLHCFSLWDSRALGISHDTASKKKGLAPPVLTELLKTTSISNKSLNNEKLSQRAGIFGIELCQPARVASPRLTASDTAHFRKRFW